MQDLINSPLVSNKLGRVASTQLKNQGESHVCFWVHLK